VWRARVAQSAQVVMLDTKKKKTWLFHCHCKTVLISLCGVSGSSLPIARASDVPMRPKPLMATLTAASVVVFTAAAWFG
jgi:hypothetical protein